MGRDPADVKKHIQTRAKIFTRVANRTLSGIQIPPGLEALWEKVSILGVDPSLSPAESKFEIIINQLMLVFFITLLAITSTLLIAYGWLLHINYDKYLNYGWVTVPLTMTLLGAGAILRYRERLGHYLVPFTLFCLAVEILIVSAAIMFGSDFSLEYWLMLLLAMQIYLLYRNKKWMLLLSAVTLLLFLGLKHWHTRYPAIFPIDVPAIKTIYYYLTAVYMFAMTTVIIAVISRQTEAAEEQFTEQRNVANTLLENILPQKIVADLKAGKTAIRQYDQATVMFTDFVGFTRIAGKLAPQDLVRELDECFSAFDTICERHGLEKLKTIGDSYMCAGGIPEANSSHARDAVNAALDMLEYIAQRNATRRGRKQPVWKIRIGIHTGPLVAGIIGHKKFSYDVWGDTVNLASRMESHGLAGRVTISRSTRDALGGEFKFVNLGKIAVKNRGLQEMFVVTRHPRAAA